MQLGVSKKISLQQVQLDRSKIFCLQQMQNQIDVSKQNLFAANAARRERYIFCLLQMQLDVSKKNLFAANAARRAAVTENPRLHSVTSRRTVQETQLGLTDKQVHSCSLKPQFQLSASFHLSNSKCTELPATISTVHVDVFAHMYHHNQEYLNVSPHRQ